jgi:hypothetical protein
MMAGSPISQLRLSTLAYGSGAHYTLQLEALKSGDLADRQRQFR